MDDNSIFDLYKVKGGDKVMLRTSMSTFVTVDDAGALLIHRLSKTDAEWELRPMDKGKIGMMHSKTRR